MQESDDHNRREEELQVLKSVYGEEAVEVIEFSNNIKYVSEVVVSINADGMEDVIVKVGAKIPNHYPSKNQLECFISCVMLTSDTTNRLLQVAQQVAKENIGEVAIFAIVEAIRDFIRECLDLQSQAKADEEELEALCSSLAASWCHGHEGKLGRRLLYSHHIASSQKRRLIQEWAHDLDLGVWCKIGWPGIIMCEGDELCCQEYVRRLQCLRWKHIVVRGEQVESIPEGCELDALRVIPYGCTEFGNDEMKELARLSKEAGLEELFLASMKIYH